MSRGSTLRKLGTHYQIPSISALSALRTFRTSTNFISTINDQIRQNVDHQGDRHQVQGRRARPVPRRAGQIPTRPVVEVVRDFQARLVVVVARHARPDRRADARRYSQRRRRPCERHKQWPARAASCCWKQAEGRPWAQAGSEERCRSSRGRTQAARQAGTQEEAANVRTSYHSATTVNRRPPRALIPSMLTSHSPLLSHHDTARATSLNHR